MYITLKPLSERKVGVMNVIARLRKKTAQIAGATLYLQAVAGSDYRRQIRRTRNINTRCRAKIWISSTTTRPLLLAKLRTIRQLTDVSSDQQNSGLAANLVIDRKTASRLGHHAATYR